MRDIRATGSYADVVDARSPLDPHISVRLGAEDRRFRRYRDNGLFTAIAQNYRIVQGGGVSRHHVFCDFNRPPAVGADAGARLRIGVYSCRPQVDYDWSGTPFSRQPVEEKPGPGILTLELMPATAAGHD